jgi:hypothetical protein
MLGVSRREAVSNHSHSSKDSSKDSDIITHLSIRRDTSPPSPEATSSERNSHSGDTKAYNTSSRPNSTSENTQQDREAGQAITYSSLFTKPIARDLKTSIESAHIKAVEQQELCEELSPQSGASMKPQNQIGKPLPPSPGPDLPDKDSPYIVPTSGAISRPRGDSFDEETGLESASTTFADQYYPAPVLRNAASLTHLGLPEGQPYNRLVSTASISTTKASRGSPPPPATPTDATPSGERSKYPFSPDAYHAQVAQQVRDQSPAQATFLQQANRQVPGNGLQLAGRARAASGPTPTNTLPSTTYANRQVSAPQSVPEESRLERDMTRVRIEDPPPPAYATVNSPAASVPDDKALAADRAELAIIGDHPAFAQENAQTEAEQTQSASKPATTPAPQQMPPPLPEGWISHLDAKSGQYYYIHLPTQATQWEFPKNPLPINMPEPTSPSYAGSMYGGMSSYDRSMPSPGIVSQYATYPPHMYNMTPMASPTAAGFMQAPPSAGLEQFRVAPSNGVYFGPYLRYTNMDLENGIWHGSVMLLTEMPVPPTMHIHKSNDLSPNRRSIRNSKPDHANSVYSTTTAAFCGHATSEVDSFPL